VCSLAGAAFQPSAEIVKKVERRLSSAGKKLLKKRVRLKEMENHEQDNK